MEYDIIHYKYIVIHIIYIFMMFSFKKLLKEVIILKNISTYKVLSYR